MAQDSGRETITQLYTELQKYAQNTEWEKALKAASKLVHETKGEKAAFQCKIVCLVKLSKFEEVLDYIQKNSTHQSSVLFEKAYSEYRLNKTEDALNTLRSSDEPNAREKELLAQVLYRLEQYKESYGLYKELIRECADDYEEERMTNLTAVGAMVRYAGLGDVEDIDFEGETFELRYNQATSLVFKGDLKKANQLLDAAEKMGTQSLEDDELTAEEIDAELTSIRCQKGYVLQRFGRNEEAMKMYNHVLKSKPSDVAVVAAASNNVVTINKDQNVFESKKRMKAATSEASILKLTSAQKKTISFNQALLSYYAGQKESSRQMLKTHKETYGQSEETLILEAALLVKEKQAKKAVDLVKEYCDANETTGVAIKMLLVQLMLMAGNVNSACGVLRSLGDMTYRLGVVGAIVTLYMSMEDKEAAGDFLMEAVTWYQKNRPGSPEMNMLMRECAEFHMKHGQPQKAAKVLEEFRRHDRSNVRLLAQLVTAYSQFDPDKALKLSAELPSLEELSRDVNVDELDSGFMTFASKQGKKLASKDSGSPLSKASAAAPALLEKKKKKKKKKKNLPKNYDPKVQPDPERWLPLRERSYYRGRRKRKTGKDVGKGTQGAATGPSDLEQSKAPAASPGSGGSGSAPQSPHPGSQGAAAAAAKKPTAAQQQQQQKKKKKKGGKW